MCAWIIDDLLISPGIFQRRICNAIFWKISGDRHILNLERTRDNHLTWRFCVRFQISCSISNSERLKRDCDRKLRINFGQITFQRCKLYGRDRWNVWVFFKVQPMTEALVYCWWGFRDLEDQKSDNKSTTVLYKDFVDYVADNLITTRKRGNCKCIATWGSPTPRRPYPL